MSRYAHDQATGVEWYSFHLMNELIPLLGREHNTEVRLYGPKDFDIKADVPFNVKKIIKRQRRLWTLLRLSLELMLHKIDILFVPSHTLPLYFPRKSVITVHDVAFKRYPELYSRVEKWKLERATRVAVKKAWRIIVPSLATKNDLIELYNCDENKIFVIPHGAPEVPRLVNWHSRDNEKHMEQFHLKKDDLYILYVGRLESKKNLVRLVEGFARFLGEYPDWKLILAGKRGRGFEEIWKKVVELGLEENVLMPGYVDEKEKMFLLAGCRVFAFPSLYEGFGLPILEAFAMKRPVLTSNVTAMPEVAGSAAFLVDPLKVEEIGVGLKRLVSDGFFVNQLVSKGAKELEKYSWEKAAKETYEVLFG